MNNDDCVVVGDTEERVIRRWKEPNSKDRRSMQYPRLIYEDKELEPDLHHILILLWGLPPTWRFSVKGFLKIHPKLPPTTTARKIQELENIGYISRIQARGSHGRMAGTKLILWEYYKEGREYNMVHGICEK